MTFTQFTWLWAGWQGAPGYSTFRCFGDLDSTQTDAAAAAQKTLFTAFVTSLPSAVTISCDPTVKVYTDADGSLIDQRNIATLPTAVAGSAAGAFSAVTGSCIVWKTQHSLGRRMLTGRTFMVPLAGSAFDSTGRLESVKYGTTSTAIQAYINRVSAGVNGHPVVWHRPVNHSGGSSWDVTSYLVNRAGAEIRRRRD